MRSWLCGLAFATITTMGAAQATNPMFPHADPFITHEAIPGVGYVLTGTMGRNVTLFHGPTPATAAGDPHVIFAPTDGMMQIWSPTVWKMDGHWVMYFTAEMPGAKHKVYVLESEGEDVLGKYKFLGAIETGRASIDPSLLVLGGKKYLMYVTVDDGANRIWLRELAGPTTFAGKPAMIASPEYGWESGEGSTKNYPVNEGPTQLDHDGKTFIVYSATDTASPRYCLGLLTYLGGDPLQEKNWKKTPKPVFQYSPENGIYGPGRGTFAHDASGDWLLYAAKTTDAPTAARRETRAQKFTWAKDGAPDFGVPQKDGPIE